MPHPVFITQAQTEFMKSGFPPSLENHLNNARAIMQQNTKDILSLRVSTFLKNNIARYRTKFLFFYK